MAKVLKVRNAANTDWDVIASSIPDLSNYYTKSESDAITPPGAWTSYTPTWSGISSTGGVSTGKYIQIGKTVHYWARYVVGSSSISVTAELNPSLPVTKSSVSYVAANGWIDDAGTGYFALLIREGTGFISQASGTYTNAAIPSNTIPMTWAVNDSITIAGTYEAL